MSSITISQPGTHVQETLAESFSRLALSQKLGKKGGKKYRKARSKFIAAEFENYFREDTMLGNWQRLCSDLGIQDNLSSIGKCKRSLKGIWVNIWDFLDAVRLGAQVRRFGSQRLLAEYTIKNNLIYPREKAKRSGPLKILLAHIFS